MGKEILKPSLRHAVVLNSIGVNNCLPEFIDASYRVLNLRRYRDRLFVKRTVSTIYNSLILLVNKLIKILFLLFLTARRGRAYRECDL